MGKTTAQGTKHESAIRNRALLIGRTARRNAKRGIKHESDVTIEGKIHLPAVFWKAYLPAGTRRKTVAMVVLLEEDYWRLVALDTRAEYGWEIQAKASQRLGVVQTMLGLLHYLKHEARH